MKKIIDFAKNFDSTLWEQFQNYLETTEDELKDNYKGLNPQEFICFPVVIVDNTIVCFSGLQTNKERWGTGIGRCSTRMWIHPDYRQPGMTKFTGGDKFLNTTYCLPLQLAAAKLNKLDCIFISRETNLTGFEQYLNLIKINCNADFKLHPAKYNVCGSLKPVPHSCKQWVATHYLTDSGNTKWAIQMGKFNNVL